ncbi:MAG: sodium:solute symporter family protein [Candidatus Omnitrophica bacterium]|nr:sodium:solute symporter family protein [Candidatus Omnitrophota bacterium]
MEQKQIYIILGVIFYMIVMLFIGYFASKKIKNTKDYIIAGGRLGWFLSIGTLFATWFGAETCMGSSATAYEKGILGVIADPFGAGLCLIISGLFFARYLRSLNIQTIIDYFQFRYSKKVAAFLSIIYIPVYLGWIGAQLLAFGYILNSLTGLPLINSIMISTIVVIVYTYAGGMWADTLTDLFQGLILICGLVILLPIFIKDIGGLNIAKAKISKEFFYFYPKSKSFLDWLNYIQAWIIVGLGSLPAQDLFARIMASKSPKIARWSSIIAGFLYVSVGLIPVFLGIFGRIVFNEIGEKNILIELSLRYLSPLFMALMVGALLSAIMSSADSALLAPASIIGHNIVPLILPKASERFKLNSCKLSVVFLCILSLVLAIYFKNIYQLCLEAWGILLVGVVAPLIAGVYWKKANSFGATGAAIGGVLFWIILKTFSPSNYPHNLLGFLASAIFLITFSLLSQKN